jgi:hypothetical protein
LTDFDWLKKWSNHHGAGKKSHVLCASPPSPQQMESSSSSKGGASSLVSETLLQELEKQFKNDRKLVGSMTGLIQFNFLFKGKLAGVWSVSPSVSLSLLPIHKRVRTHIHIYTLGVDPVPRSPSCGNMSLQRMNSKTPLSIVIQFSLQFSLQFSPPHRHMTLKGQNGVTTLTSGKPRTGKADVVMTIEDRVCLRFFFVSSFLLLIIIIKPFFFFFFFFFFFCFPMLQDFLKMASGGLSGKKAFSLKKLKIKGDFLLAQDFEHRFLQVGGPARAIDFLKSNPTLAQKAKL